VYYGTGFTHSEVYEMPVYLRKFYIQKLIRAKKQEQEQIDKARKKTQSKIHRPGIN